MDGTVKWQHATVHEFIQLLAGEVSDRVSFVPLLGAGFSANSGIPTAVDLRTYLRYCIARVLGRTSDDSFCPRFDPWPDQSAAWQTPLTDAVLGDCIDDDISETRRRLVHQAGGTRGDWREMLRFLAKVDRTPEEENKKGEVFLSAASEGVIDSAFVHLTDRRKPNLAHLMLAHLSESFRINTILTTNFDALVEAAFSRMAMPLRVFDVHLKAGLPHPRLVCDQRSIVKLHGSRFGLRADESLDLAPSVVDQKTFVGYLAKSTSPVRLLVMGASGYEPRTLSLLQAAAQELKDGLRIYWVCYRDEEPDLLKKEVLDSVIAHSSVTTTVHRDLGLFLLEVYQRVVLSLPPAGADFPAFPRVPPYLYTLPGGKSPLIYDSKKLSAACDDLADRIERKQSLIAIGGEEPSGVSLVAEKLFDDLSTKKHCLWFDLAAFAQPDDFYAALVRAVAEKVASWPGLPLLPEYDAKDCRGDVHQLTRKSPREFLVVINGREGLGTTAHHHPGTEPTGWDPKAQDEFWRGISRLQGNGINFVVLWGKKSLNAPNKPLDRANDRRAPEFTTAPIGTVLATTPPNAGALIVDKIKQLNEAERPQFLRFVYSLFLMRRPRHPAVMWSWVLLKAPEPGRRTGDNDLQRSQTANEYCKFLLEKGIGGFQPGGGLWLHSSVRDSVLPVLEREFADNLKQVPPDAECHQGIADWYVKLFRASNDPAAAMESIYHRLSCAVAAAANNDPFYRKRGEQMEVTALVEAVQTLELARDRILSAGYYAAFRRLVEDVDGFFNTRHTLAPSVVDEVRIRLHRMRRDFARDTARFHDARRNCEAVEPRPTRMPPDSDLEDLKCRYEDTNCTVGLRAYDEALKKFAELFQALGLRPVITLIDDDGNLDELAKARLDDPRKYIGRMREVAHEWSRNDHSEERRQLAIKVVRRHMFLLMLIGQTRRLVAKLKDDRSERDKDLFVAAEGDYALATAMMRYCWDHEFLQRENVAIRGHAAVMLATLGRFHEAHRRLNEAWGYLVRAQARTSGTVAAIMDLRRAEVYLRQAQDASPAGSNPNPTKALAFLEDADSALTRASTRWLTEPTRAWWRTLSCELALSVRQQEAIVKGQVPLPQELLAAAEETLKEVFRVTKTDVFRLTQAIRIWTEMGGNTSPNFVQSVDEWDEALKERYRLRPNPAPLVTAYVDCVRSTLQRLRTAVNFVQDTRLT